MENEKKYTKQDLIDALDKFFECIEKLPEKVESALASLKLENVAHYLNEVKYKDVEWTKYKYHLYNDGSEISTDNQIRTYHFNGSVCFKSEEIAKEAIQILGEEIIKTALKN